MNNSRARAYQLGMGEKAETPRNPKKTRNKKDKNNRNRSGQPEGGGSSSKNEDGDQERGGTTNPKMRPCVWWGKLHYLNKCPTLSEEMKKWPWYMY